jgi:hypothetical protein
MRHADRADIGSDELAFDAQADAPVRRDAGPAGRPPGRRRWAPPRSCPPGCHLPVSTRLKELGDADDARGAPVEEVFELAQRSDRRVSRMAPTATIESGHRSRNSKTKGASQPGHHQRRTGCEELRRGADDHIRARQEGAGEDRRNHETHVIQRALEEALVGGDVGPHTNHVDAIHGLAAATAHCGSRHVFSRWENSALRSPLSHDGPPPPSAGVLEGTRGRGIGLGRKVVGQEEDVHRATVYQLYQSVPASPHYLEQTAISRHGRIRRIPNSGQYQKLSARRSCRPVTPSAQDCPPGRRSKSAVALRIDDRRPTSGCRWYRATAD